MCPKFSFQSPGCVMYWAPQFPHLESGDLTNEETKAQISAITLPSHMLGSGVGLQSQAL